MAHSDHIDKGGADLYSLPLLYDRMHRVGLRMIGLSTHMSRLVLPALSHVAAQMQASPKRAASPGRKQSHSLCGKNYETPMFDTLTNPARASR